MDIGTMETLNAMRYTAPNKRRITILVRSKVCGDPGGDAAVALGTVSAQEAGAEV